MNSIDKIIFGDNQFFGINHMSEKKALEQIEKFSSLESITKVIDCAYDLGIRGFMLNTNERAESICNYWRENKEKFSNLSVYPSLPYAHKYAKLVNEKGIFNSLTEIVLSNKSYKEIFGFLTKGGLSIFERNAIRAMEILIDIEMNIFRNLDIKIVFLQNIVTDLLLGLKVKEPFQAYHEYIVKKYNCKPGFNTMNLPKLVEFLFECGIENPVVCSSINKAGYFMNPDKQSYEKIISEKPFVPIAMSILASGAINAKEAVEYVCKMKNIKSIVFGASSKKNILETKSLIESYWK